MHGRYELHLTPEPLLRLLFCSSLSQCTTNGITCLGVTWEFLEEKACASVLTSLYSLWGLRAL